MVLALPLAALLAAAPDGGTLPPPAPAPTADEIKRVLDYHEAGKDLGPVLLDLVACLKVDTAKNSPSIYNCVEPVSGPVKKGTAVSAWTSWFSPKGGVYDDLAIQFAHEGLVRTTQDLKVEGGWKTRNYRANTLSKAGTWQLRVIRGGKQLGEVTVVVEEPAAPVKPSGG
jgi:hypothetical protein